MESNILQQKKVCDKYVNSIDNAVGSADLEDDVYEGVEKKLTLKYSTARHVSIQKKIKDKIWRNVVKAVDAEVLSVIQNEHVVAYLLSESSLFVFTDRICLKTCGKTRIFNAVKIIVSNIAENIPEINLIRVIYSRPTYRYPKYQLKGYNEGFESEVELLNAVTTEATRRSWKSFIHKNGKGIKFHSCTLYLDSELLNPLIENQGVESVACDQKNLIMDLAMFNVDPLKMKHFFGEQKNALEDSCLRKFLPDTPSLQIDEYKFKPCGYSLNAVDGEYFWCIHITPQAQYSYLSFETNHPSALDLNKKLQEFYAPQKAIVLWNTEKHDDYISSINN